MFNSNQATIATTPGTLLCARLKLSATLGAKIGLLNAIASGGVALVTPPSAWLLFISVLVIPLAMSVYGFVLLPYKFKTNEGSSVTFEHFPWKSAITIHLERPFDSNLKQVVRDIPALAQTLSKSGYKRFSFASPIFVKHNGEIRQAPLKLLRAKFSTYGYDFSYQQSKTPAFTKWVFRTEYKKINQTSALSPGNTVRPTCNGYCGAGRDMTLWR